MSESRVKKYNVKQAVSNELSHILFSCKHNRVFTGDLEPSREPEPTLNCLRNKTRKLKEFVHQRIRLSIGCVKVRKNVCKLNTKKVRLNEVTQHKKKYLLNCSVGVYERITKLKYRASRYSSLFCCNRLMNVCS